MSRTVKLLFLSTSSFVRLEYPTPRPERGQRYRIEKFLDLSFPIQKLLSPRPNSRLPHYFRNYTRSSRRELDGDLELGQETQKTHPQKH